MLILAFDTATPCETLALVGPEGALAELSIRSRASHSVRLLPAVRTLLDATSLKFDEVEGFAVGLGPGSFTGLRVGLATAKGLALGTGKPLAGVSTLDVLARNAAPATRICPVLDARKGEVFTAVYQASLSGSLSLKGGPWAIAPDRLLDKLCAAEEGGPIFFLGSGTRLYGDLIRDRLGEAATFVAPELDTPRASVLGRIGREALTSGRGDDPARLVPLYLRASDAEIARSLREGGGAGD